MTSYSVTVRYGRRYHRYHTLQVEGEGVVEALRSAADRIPEDVAAEGDLVELRVAADPEARRYMDEGEEESAPGGPA